MIGGLLTTILIVIATAAPAAWITGNAPTPTYLVLTIAGSAGAAFAGARLAGLIALRHHMAHAAILAAIIVLLSIPGIANPPAGFPAWYPLTVTLAAVAGALAAGRRGTRVVTGTGGGTAG